MTSPAHSVLGQARWAAAALATYDADRVQAVVAALLDAAAASGDADVRALAADPGTLTAGPLLDLSSGTQLLPSPVGVVLLLAPAERPDRIVWHAALLAAANRDVLAVASPEGTPFGDVVAAAAEAGTAAGAPQGWLQCVVVPENGVAGVDLVVVADEAGAAWAGSSGLPWVRADVSGVPAWVTSSADLTATAGTVVRSCASATLSHETALLVDEVVRDQLVDALATSGAAVLTPAETEQLGALLRRGAASTSAVELAAAAGITVPAATTLLVVPVSQVVAEDPFVQPSQRPVLALLCVASPEQGIVAARAVTLFRPGRGVAVVHTTDPHTAARLGAALGVSLVVVNAGVARPRTALEPSDLVRMTRVHDLGPSDTAPAPLASPWAAGPVPPYPLASNDPRRSDG